VDPAALLPAAPGASPFAGYRWPPEVITEAAEAAQAVWRGEVRHAGLGHGAAGQPTAADRAREVAATFTRLATTLGHAA
jgi:hypothetical protein